MQRSELGTWLRLTLTPGIGNETARKLLTAFGLPQAVFSQNRAALSQVVTPLLATALLQVPDKLPALLDATWAWLNTVDDAAPGVQRCIVALGDPAYPAGLLNIEDPPLLLYVMGTGGLPADSTRCLAIVGSRNPTAQGGETALQFARALYEAGLTVVSGLALGIDGAAHRGALEAAKTADASRHMATIAVVGTGLDRVYPKRHLTLAHAIAQNGLIVSEYPLGTPPLAPNFPRRNRIIAAMAQGTLVVEAAMQSGSLITARLAAEQGKEVFAIPGSIHSVQSRGCHHLIREGAKLVETAADILEELKLDFAMDAKALHAATARSSNESDRESPATPLLDALGFGPISLDAVQARTGLPTADLQARLMALELEDLVARLPGGLFQRLVKA
jgi:DNA processing protein